MRISELMQFLKDVERERGDIDVFVEDDEENQVNIIDARISRRGQGVAIVLLEPRFALTRPS